MIIQQVNFTSFCDSFSETYKHNFSYAGKRALFDYLEDLSDGIGESIELDTIALCCDYNEYDNTKEYNENYNTSYKTVEELEEAGVCTVIRTNGDSFIISCH